MNLRHAENCFSSGGACFKPSSYFTVVGTVTFPVLRGLFVLKNVDVHRAQSTALLLRTANHQVVRSLELMDELVYTP